MAPGLVLPPHYFAPSPKGIDAHLLLTSMFSCMEKFRGRPLKMWVRSASSTVWESNAGNSAQRLRLLSLTSAPMFVVPMRGVAAAGQVLPLWKTRSPITMEGEQPGSRASSRGQGQREQQAPLNHGQRPTHSSSSSRQQEAGSRQREGSETPAPNTAPKGVGFEWLQAQAAEDGGDAGRFDSGREHEAYMRLHETGRPPTAVGSLPSLS